jgi:ParB family chromosome partitioning protein
VEEIVAVGDTETEENDKLSQKRTKQQDPVLADLAAALADTWDTPVQVELGKTKGTISIAFASIDDLERLVELMAPAAVSTLTARAG